MSKFKEFTNKVALKFANTFSGPRLTAAITVLVIFAVLGIVILVRSLI